MLQAGIILLLVAAPAAAADYQVVMTTDPVKLSTAASTSCNDKLYAFITLPKLSTGTHLLEGRWFRPDGTQQEYTKVPLDLRAPGQTRLQLWLKIERAGDAVDALFTHGEDDDFDGGWLLDVYYDSKKVSSKKFSIHCL